MSRVNKGSVTLVGAGPGDPDLLTLKGLKAIQKSDVILYDALINPVLLEHNPTAKKIFVGKRRDFVKKKPKRKSTHLSLHTPPRVWMLFV